jgi:hypothetical protein
MVQDGKADEWALVASGLLVCVATVCVAYFVARLWPRSHYPRLFGTLAGVATVAILYVIQVPGAGFGLIALAFVAYIALHAPETWEALFEADTQSPKKPAPSRAPAPSLSGLGFFTTGLLVGLLLSAATIATFVLPPAHWKAWLLHPDAVNDRIVRALSPGEQWVTLQDKERIASGSLKKAQAELAALTKRATDAEAALEKARDDLGALSPNTVRGIQIKSGNGSRHANGAVYIAVNFSNPYENSCRVNLSSDTVLAQGHTIAIGTAAALNSSKGKYRVVLTAVDKNGCTLDLVKD